jgi:hypothetical protein
MVTQIGYSVARQSRDRVTLCAVYTVHKDMNSVGFLAEPQNHGRRFISYLASKPLGQFVGGLASKPLGRFVGGSASKPLGRFVSAFASKPLRRVFLIWPQNQWRWFLPV